MLLVIPGKLVAPGSPITLIKNSADARFGTPVLIGTLSRALLPTVNDPGTAIHVTTRALIKQRDITKASIRKLIQENLRFRMVTSV